MRGNRRERATKFQDVTCKNEKKNECGEGGSGVEEGAKSVMKNAEGKKV